MAADDDVATALARHATAVSTVRDFGRRAQAERVVLLVDLGDGDHAAMIEWRPGTPLELTEGETTWSIPEESAGAVPPLALAAVRPAPASAVTADEATGEIAAPLGTVEHLADVVLDLARAFGGRSLAAVDFPTADPAQPVTIAGRAGEPVLVAIGETQFELPGGSA